MQSSWARGAAMAASLFLAIGGCSEKDKDGKEKEQVGKPAEAKERPPAALDEAAREVLGELAALEKEKDVTCWTSFRQLDWYIAEKSYSEFGTLAKIAAMKRLVRAVWAKAARSAQGDKVTVADIEAAAEPLPDVGAGKEEKEKLASFANDIGLQNYSDYQKTAEHWRVVLAVLMDEIHSGGPEALKPLETKALKRLADAATTLSLLLLKRSGAAAEEKKSPLIEGAHVKAAYAEIAREHDLVNPERKRSPLPAAEAARRLQPLTRALIDGKIEALQVYNKTSDELIDDLNRVSRVPLTEDAVAILTKDLQSFTHFVAAGFEPMRADNYLSDGSYARSTMPRLAYVDEIHVQNVLEQIFPHQMLNNGDVRVRFEPNPGPVTDREREPFEIKMLDHEMNGVRDSALHWIVMRNVFKEAKFGMDPFGAEYLSEVISMMMTLYIRRGELLAKEQGKEEIDAAIANRIRDRSYVLVPPVEEETAAWGPQKERAKRALLSRYPRALYADRSASSGLPTEGYRGESLDDVEGHGAVQGHVAPDLSSVQGHFDIQRIMGGGIAVGDVDGDDYPDLFLSGEGLGRLYLNRGKEAPGRFENATKKWGIPEGMDDGHGSLLFDMEGDGDLDLLVLRSEHRSLLLRQDDGRFTDVTEEVGLKTHRGSHVAAIFDYDGDGDLDIYVGYYGNHRSNIGKSKERSLPALDGRNGSPNQLWRLGPDGRYQEVGARAGVADVGWTLAVGAFDHEMDGDLDLYLANDFGANQLYLNGGDGQFERATEASGTGDRGSGMNVDFGDVNGDGRWDIYVTNIDMFSKRIKVVFPRDESTISIDEELARSFQYLSGNKFYLSNIEEGAEHPYEAEEHARFEPGDRGWGWDASFFDYENDGDDDMYLTNGWIDGSYAGNQKNQMFLQESRFFYMGPTSSAEAFAGNTRSAAAVDFDLDGDIDLVTNNFRQAPRLLENVQRKRNRWLKLKLRGKGKNTRAIGALLRIEPAGDAGHILRHVTCGRGYLSQADPVITAGLGAARTADVFIRWPDGEEQTLSGLAAGKVHEVEQEKTN